MTALPTVGSINYPSVEEIRDGALRTIKVCLARQGIAISVLPGSEPFARAEAWARRAVIAFANNRIKYADLNPLTARGDNLKEVAGIFGVFPRPASKSTGFVKIKSSGNVTIPAGYRNTAGNGEQYDVISGGTFASGAPVEVVSVNTGRSTRQVPGTQLTWNSAAIGALNVLATVDSGGIDGGEDEDTEDTLRRRLLDRLANPAGGGNAAQVRQLAEEATAAVGRAYVYMAVRGPSTVDVAALAADGDRTLSDATVASVAANLTTLPGHADVNVTSVTAEPVIVVLLARLPFPLSSGGSGGGWADASPWPRGIPVMGSNDGKIIAYNAGTGIATVRTTDAPAVGNRIGIWDTTGQAMNEYTIKGPIGGSTGAWTFSVQGLDGSVGFKVAPSGYVSAGAVNLTLYAAKFLELMLALGPGEKTDDPDVLPRGQRQPVMSGNDPTDLDNRMLGVLMGAYPELECQYGLRLDNAGTSEKTSPTVPANTLNPPNVLTLKYFAIWKA